MRQNAPVTLSALPAPVRGPEPASVTLTDLAESAVDLGGFDPALVREVAARMPVHDGPFTLMHPVTVQQISVRHHTLGTLVCCCHLLLHQLHAGTGTHPVAIADLFAADQARRGTGRPPLLALALLRPDPVQARAWAEVPPQVTVVEDALDRWGAPTLIEIGTALSRAAHPAFSLDD